LLGEHGLAQNKGEGNMRLSPAVSMLLGLCVTANAAMAADLPKEGTSTGTFSAFATFKATVIGKDRILTSFDGNGPSLTNGFADHMTWHCWGAGDYTNGTGRDEGYCVGTDISGDQLIDIFTDDKHALDAKSYTGSDKWSGGSGKYTNISGGGRYTCESAAFKAPAPGTAFLQCTVDWNYKFASQEASR
jgi:hypothetical protein